MLSYLTSTDEICLLSLGHVYLESNFRRTYLTKSERVLEGRLFRVKGGFNRRAGGLSKYTNISLQTHKHRDPIKDPSYATEKLISLFMTCLSGPPDPPTLALCAYLTSRLHQCETICVAYLRDSIYWPGISRRTPYLAPGNQVTPQMEPNRP